jgi:hypothetical protein
MTPWPAKSYALKDEQAAAGKEKSLALLRSQTFFLSGNARLRGGD